MKKRNMFFSAAIAILSLTAFEISFWEKGSEDNFLTIDFEFAYRVESRFVNTVSKEQMVKASTILDILPTCSKDITNSKYSNIKVTKFAENRNDWTTIEGPDEVLTKEQTEILNSLEYGSSFSITGNVSNDFDSGIRYSNDTLIYYMTVVPEKPAAYSDGNDALVEYLKKNSEEVISIAQRDRIQPGKISFNVTRKGSIDSVSLDNTSGYKSIDDTMLKLIRNIPGNWNIATDSQGKKVDHRLTFFFGIVGC